MRLVSGSPGRTLLEVVVAAAIMAGIGLVVAGIQATGFRWERADREAVRLLQPLRDGSAYLKRDLNMAAHLQFPADGSLVIYLRYDDEYHRVTYRRQDTELLRELCVLGNDLSAGCTTARRQVVATGVSEFSAALDADGLVHLVLQVSSAGATPVTRGVELRLASRLGGL